MGRRQGRRLGLRGYLVILLIISCGIQWIVRSTDDAPVAGTGAVQPTATTRVLPSTAPTQMVQAATPTPRPTLMPVGWMTRAELGDAWPFTVDAGEVRCVGPARNSIIFVSNNKTYAVNGIAQSNPDYADVEEIWADAPNDPELKINISPIIERGLELCK